MACGTHILPPGENACALYENACRASSVHLPTKVWVVFTRYSDLIRALGPRTRAFC